MNKFLEADGPIFNIITSIGNLIIASILWIIGCLPVITIGTSTAALYYTVVKSIRKEVGYVHKEFWKSYKFNLKNGIASTIFILCFLLVITIEFQMQVTSTWRTSVMIVSIILFFIIIYLYPVMSRFDMKLGKIINLSFIMSIRYFYVTIILCCGLGAIIYLQIFLLPMPFILVTPGLWCYGSSYLIEYILKKYMPKQEADDSQWYY